MENKRAVADNQYPAQAAQDRYYHLSPNKRKGKQTYSVSEGTSREKTRERKIAAPALQRPARRQRSRNMCSINRSFNTTYNDKQEVPPYTGIMFEVTARAEAVIVNAFELDLRLENATDLTVEIYTLQGYYGDEVGKPDKWTLIANTEVVLSFGGGGIVPVQKIVPVRIDAAQRQSFYITMKGPYLDHNVNALQKTGELQSTGEDLNVYVGSGLTDYKFPGLLDKVLHPMFAGVIHYEIPYDCDTIATSTTVFEFSVLFRKSVGNKADVTNAISNALNELLTQDPQLRTYVSDFSLVKQKGETEPLPYTRKYWSIATTEKSSQRILFLRTLF
jgi:hypothetical protein